MPPTKSTSSGELRGAVLILTMLVLITDLLRTDC